MLFMMGVFSLKDLDMNYWKVLCSRFCQLVWSSTKDLCFLVGLVCGKSTVFQLLWVHWELLELAIDWRKGDGINDADMQHPDFAIIFVNGRLWTTTGYNAKEVLGTELPFFWQES